MKKIYLTPQTSVIHVQASQMIAESLEMKKGSTVSDEGAVLSKENQNGWGNIWDDEE